MIEHFLIVKYISPSNFKFELSEAFLCQFSKKKRVETADASSEFTKRTRERFAFVEGTIHVPFESLGKAGFGQ